MNKFIIIILAILPTYCAIMFNNQVPATAIMILATILGAVASGVEEAQKPKVEAWWSIHLIGIMVVIFYFTKLV